MSRIAKQPVSVPAGVQVTLDGQRVSVKGPKGSTELSLHEGVSVEEDSEGFTMKSKKGSMALAGTMRSLLNNAVQGVSVGFEKKLELVGIGFRAQAQGNKLNLTIGFSHPVNYIVPEGVSIETPSQTEILVKGIDKQKVGQVAAEIRAYRPPEPYKGKGVKYANERVVRKEAKKK
ncbi:MAG: 50S ribosomal protein L6 [Pseudomonadota bacterium]|nr:50S ribosomal protein L6 [Pseudomonadota bacterium]